MPRRNLDNKIRCVPEVKDGKLVIQYYTPNDSFADMEALQLQLKRSLEDFHVAHRELPFSVDISEIEPLLDHKVFEMTIGEVDGAGKEKPISGIMLKELPMTLRPDGCLTDKVKTFLYEHGSGLDPQWTGDAKLVKPEVAPAAAPATQAAPTAPAPVPSTTNAAHAATLLTYNPSLRYRACEPQVTNNRLTLWYEIDGAPASNMVNASYKQISQKLINTIAKLPPRPDNSVIEVAPRLPRMANITPHVTSKIEVLFARNQGGNIRRLQVSDMDEIADILEKESCITPQEAQKMRSEVQICSSKSGWIHTP